MIHRIRAPDIWNSRRPRTVLWDDRRGTVRGDHGDAQDIDAVFERSKREVPLVIEDVSGRLALNDPRHSAPDFMALALLYLPGPVEFPDSLRGETPTAWEGGLTDLPEGVVLDPAPDEISRHATSCRHANSCE